jgi:peroxiredoxin
VLLVLLGREGCPGTRKATAVLDSYVPRRPAGVDVIRVDVPLPGERYVPIAGWGRPYGYAVDAGRRLAGELDFFFYPTLYVFDRDGELRFAGGCELARVEAMVGELLAERPGAPKRSYSLALVPEGQPAPDFAGTDPDGGPAALEALRGVRATLLFFAASSCPFSVQELANLRGIAEAYRDKGVAVAIINRGQTAEEIRPVYRRHVPELPVVWDRSGEICRAYGVDAVPFYYLLDADGKVVRRRSFTPAAAAGAVNALLGVGPEPLRFKPSEAG